MSGAEALAGKLLPKIREWRAEHGTGLFTLGISGAQGSGKSSLAKALSQLLADEGLRVATLSLDDLYLTRAERQQLARDIHPLFATRGVPGTHDIALGLATLDALARGEPAPLPRFDKARDDRAPQADWPHAPAQCEVLILEGWCLGAVPQPVEALTTPVNSLEAEEDHDGVWRNHVNAALVGGYQALWARVDRLILLAAPNWEVVKNWREQQEAELRERASGAMNPAEVIRFIQHYERLTRWILEELPSHASLSLRLAAGRDWIED